MVKKRSDSIYADANFGPVQKSNLSLKNRSNLKCNIIVDKSLCTLCKTCVLVCPENTIKESKKQITIDKKFCKMCLICLEECPRKAIKQI